MENSADIQVSWNGSSSPAGVPDTSAPSLSASASEKPRVKRIRTGDAQPPACKECARMKLRCSRSWPCTSCVRRGCAPLCPNGTLEKGTRSFLSRVKQSQAVSGLSGLSGLSESSAMFVGDIGTSPAVEERGQDAVALRKRIDQLERLLTAHQPLSIRLEGQRARSRTESESAADDQPEEDSDAKRAGTLYVYRDGNQRYHSSNAGSAYFAASAEESTPPSGSSDVSSEIGSSGHGPPFHSTSLPGLRGELTSSAQLYLIRASLPSRDQAIRRAENFFEIGCLVYEILTPDAFYKGYLPGVYDFAGLNDVPPHPHHLAVVCMVLALGTLLDLSVPFNVARINADPFHDLARKAMGITHSQSSGTFWELGTVAGVQCLHMMCSYLLNSRATEGSDSCWLLLGLAMRSMQQVGLHRDAEMWGIKAVELEERRRTFWEVQALDRFVGCSSHLVFFSLIALAVQQAVCFGRPYGLGDRHHDCKMPREANPPMTEIVGDPLAPSAPLPDSTFSHVQWHHYKFRLSTLIGSVVDTAFSVRASTYNDTLDLDNSIRKFEAALPSFMRCLSLSSRPAQITRQPSLPNIHSPYFRQFMRQHSFSNIIVETLLHLHRAPFTQAVLESPNDPTASPYGRSVTAATEAARSIINIAYGVMTHFPALLERIWYFLFHTFSAACCQALVAIRAPHCSLASAAIRDLEAAAVLFEHVESPRAREGARVLRKLFERANHFARDHHTSHAASFGSQDEVDGLVGAASRMIILSSTNSNVSEARLISNIPEMSSRTSGTETPTTASGLSSLDFVQGYESLLQPGIGFNTSAPLPWDRLDTEWWSSLLLDFDTSDTTSTSMP